MMSMVAIHLPRFVSSADMALNPSIPPRPMWGASPVAGRLPGDPYYKLGLQAELNRRERALARGADKSWQIVEQSRNHWEKASKPLSLLDKFATVATQVIGAKPIAPVRAQIASTAWTTAGGALYPSSASGMSEQVIPAPAPIVPLPSSVAADPPKPAVEKKVDSIIAGHQVDSEAWLEVVCPASLSEFRLAAGRLQDAADAVGDEQAGLLAQGLESLRRALRKLADALYPPASGPIEDRFGQQKRTDDAGYISRIGLALQEAKLPQKRSRLEKAELDDLHRRFQALQGRLSDKVHGDGEFKECQTLYVDAWRVVGICRLYLRTDVADEVIEQD
jgi:hypothetical protein